MSKKEQWQYENGKLKGKVTTKTDSKGNKEVVRQKAFTDSIGGRQAGSVTGRTKYTK